MRSMIEQVKEAEAQAAAIRQDAQSAGRDRVATAQAEAKAHSARTAEVQRSRTRDALKDAEASGEALRAEIIAAREIETDAACAKAAQKLPEAVTYLLGRVVKSV